MERKGVRKPFETLKPCPFCGGNAQTVKSSGRWGWFVSCRCAAVGPSSQSREAAIEAWNDRKEPEQLSIFDVEGV